MTSYGTPADKIVGYTFNCENLCPSCTCTAVMEANGVIAMGVNAEHWLDRMAVELGINRYDEREYDSSDFPKVIFASQCMETEFCDHCGEALL